MFPRFNKTRPILLSADADTQPPTEFRLFVKGWNETENGRFLFDDAAAKSVMSSYKAWGVDLAIDLEHQMLEGDAPPDPTARDARGWFQLELRPDGSLWAVNVKWTPDGAERLQQKRQRYISPAFEADRETKRVSKILNAAITAMPATHHTPALVAASKGRPMNIKAIRNTIVALAAGGGMDPDLIAKALDAVEKGDAKAALEILKGLIASAAGAEPAPSGDEPGAEGDGAEGAPPEAEAAKPPPPKSSAPPADGSGDDDDDPKKKTEQRAMNALLYRLTSKGSLSEALAQVQLYRDSHVTLESERQKLSAERATLESAERRSLCIELVRIGAEFPSTVWADASATAPKKRWAKMPIEELRSHVSEQRAARKGTTKKIEPAKDGNESGEGVELTVEELQVCKSQGCDPKDFAQLKAFRDGKSKKVG